jgi:hypothetical protein
VQRGGTEVPWVAYIGSEWRREAVPRWPWPSMAGLERELRGIKGGNGRLMRGNEGETSLRG